jgi:hypothetical protein
MTFTFARTAVHVTALALVFLAGLFSGVLSPFQSVMIISIAAIGFVPALLAWTSTRATVTRLLPREVGR